MKLLDISHSHDEDGALNVELFFENRRVILCLERPESPSKSCWAIASMPPHERDSSGTLDDGPGGMTVADVLSRAQR